MNTVYSVPVEVKLSVAFMMVDVFTGILKAVKNKELSSTRAREGIYKKASFILFIAFGYLADYAMDYVDLGFNFPAAATICTLIILTEAISVLENLGQINPDLVKLVAPFLSALNSKKEEGERND
jgi:toxin secretion/phage lysis holin|nr:MAG TPA: holin [Caudoviricetes sp.]